MEYSYFLSDYLISTHTLWLSLKDSITIFISQKRLN